MNESKICMTDSTGIIVSTMKNIYNESNSGKSSTVDPPSARQRIGVRERFTLRFALGCSCLQKVQVIDPCD